MSCWKCHYCKPYQSSDTGLTIRTCCHQNRNYSHSRVSVDTYFANRTTPNWCPRRKPLPACLNTQLPCEHVQVAPFHSVDTLCCEKAGSRPLPRAWGSSQHRPEWCPYLEQDQLVEPMKRHPMRRSGPWRTTNDEPSIAVTSSTDDELPLDVPSLEEISRSMVKGKTLDAMAAAVGLVRNKGEGDKALKKRILFYLKARVG